jgi:L-ornithine Nalpha-acyltransferase
MSSLFSTLHGLPPGRELFETPLRYGGWEVRLAEGREDMAAVLALRALAFRGHATRADTDAFDSRALHLWIGPEAGAAPLATIRVLVHADGRALLGGYCAQYYALEGLAHQPGLTLELGRLCLDPGHHMADLVRLIWAGVARLVAQLNAARLIGCPSFAGMDAGALAPHLAALAVKHLGPEALRPGPRAPERVNFVGLAPATGGAPLLPPLLRVCLGQGGWMGDHLVVDRDLGTCHVFTCVDIAAMPEGRKRILRVLAAQG